ncbi:Folate-dependent protein for Fe/S cluster synthesis/repair in oxidative stress [Pseudonocardia sp. Ae168_Ps1]|uniref:CAF17-like 4Fe-4S cluster assembly/insertion protein YgfZ n=1 Tax=unclassified Pseudonocardia TaxID=2619320 RepID=UPI00094B74DC|nr:MULTISPECIES: glycine cleavage T C-terminal barrel domain-containing protein [unclassified Pseudonocardia]OLL75320.1 Folate-dependent protein for Fe/S cluster synthesis/repair in oxidative stress [Pseudonocardia sp. Ae150A_Ps1]OLL81315.1 Folate-dependent protein for Fe/S cluster synthesis/repair in oxidative stress [Pseudonocardia sp. Ae168_Ps1]OLL84572.1 Folate-dependent protein for Fe/S cluster synthesis/repair in oxidative stress [Pseudonocardia sp. Ae263_Ps1]OLL95409.1 Folate-dependent p
MTTPGPEQDTDTTGGPADPDAAVPAHHGDPPAEQRAMARAAAVVDRSHREVIAVSGEERLSWLHLLLTQHVSELPPDTGTEALVLDVQGRVLHHMAVASTGDTVYLDTEPGEGAPLLDYLTKMVFWSKVEPRDVTGELAVLGVVGPDVPDVLEKAGLPLPPAPHRVAALPGGGFVRRTPWPGRDAVDVVVPRDATGTWWSALTAAGARAAGTIAFEALRVESRAPRLHRDTDDRTIPHEVGWIGPAVHLTKGCYRGQETVARVANLGRPPRRQVLLLLDAGDEELPRTGDPVRRDDRTVGRVGTVVQHHELGPVALALVKRSVPADAELTAGVDDRVSPATIDPDSYEQDPDNPPPGRAARERTAGAARRTDG